MNLQLEPLPGDVAHLLSRGATQLEPSAHTRFRLRQRLARHARGRGVTAAIVPQPSLGSFFGRAVGSRLLIGLSSFVLGAGASAVLSRATGRTPIVTPVAEPPPTIAPPSATPPAPTVTPAPSPLKSSRRAAPRARVAVRPILPVASTAPLTPPMARSATKSELRLEGELLERGRIAMVRGDNEGALEAADEHLRRFPTGKLGEEREALRVQALVSEDRIPEARVALRAFREAYPQSLAGSALEAAVAGR